MTEASRTRGCASSTSSNLARIDVGAAGNDQILGAVLEGEITVSVESADVAGMQPPAAQRLRARLRIAPIAGHDDVAAAEDFAELANRQHAILRVRHDHV